MADTWNDYFLFGDEPTPPQRLTQAVGILN